MFDIIVDVKVRLSSGATIELTEEQNKKIKNAALDVILGESLGKPDKKTVTKAKQPKRVSYFHWTEEAKNELKSIIARFAYLKPKAHHPEKAAALRAFRMKYRVSRAALDSRIYVIKNEMKSKVSTTAPTHFVGYSRPTSLLG